MVVEVGTLLFIVWCFRSRAWRYGVGRPRATEAGFGGGKPELHHMVVSVI